MEQANAIMSDDESVPPAPAPLFVTVDEAAEMLRISRGTIYEQLRAGIFPGGRKVGSHYRIHRPTLMQWAEHGITQKVVAPRLKRSGVRRAR